MRYRLLGSSGLRVAELSLGSMTFGENWGWGAAEPEARRVYDAYREAGGNFIDTANIYTDGTSETFLGEFVRGHRERIVLATKFANAAPGDDPNAAGNHRKAMIHSLEGSLKRLRTDYVDLYWVHIWDGLTPADEIMRGLDDLVRQGKVLYVGISDAPAWLVAHANTLADLRGWSRFVGLQVEYSLLERTPERELLPMARALGIGVTAWSPLAGGMLTGKYRAGGETGGRYDDPDMRQFLPVEERRDRVVDAVLAVATEVERSPSQVALAWLRRRGVIPIVGARTVEQLRDNLASVELTLDDDQTRRLDEASRIDLGFPGELYTREMVRLFRFAGFADRIDR